MWKVLTATLTASVILAGAAGIAYAGGWATLKLDSLPTDIVAGETTIIGFTVLQHGERPLPNLEAYITATNVETGERLHFDATDQGEPGHYQAQVIFPRQGAWEWSVNAFGDHPMPALQVLAVADSNPAPVVAVAPSKTTSSTASLASGQEIAVGLAVTGTLLLVSAGLLAFWHRRPDLRPSRAATSTLQSPS